MNGTAAGACFGLFVVLERFLTLIPPLRFKFYQELCITMLTESNGLDAQ
jgi:hypothetical protein